MKKNAVGLVIAVLAGFLFTVPVSAEEKAYDPMQRNLIFVEGEAEDTMAANMFKLTFDFDVQEGSFIEAVGSSESVISEITRKVNGMELPKVEIIKGWDFIKQAVISIGQSGKKISNRLTIKVTDFPEGKMHSLIARIIDACLSANKDVYFKEIVVGVSEDVENRKREEVMAAALKKLKSNAEKSAQTQGANSIEAKRIYITGDVGEGDDIYAGSRSRYSSLAPESTSEYRMAKLVSIQKGFAVESQASDRITISAKVSGIYEIK